MMVFQDACFEKTDFEKKQQQTKLLKWEKLPKGERVSVKFGEYPWSVL